METKKEVCPGSEKRRGAVSKLCAVSLAGVLAISMVAMTGCQKQESAASTSEQNQAAQKVEMTFDLTVANWDKSVPIIVHITGTTAEGKTVDVYHAFIKASDTYSDLPDGTYSVEYVSPINKDGSLYTVPAKQTITIKDGEAKVETTFTKVPADQVTSEQAAETIEQIGQAVAKGDDTLKGGTGKDIINNAATNATAAPNVSPDTATNAADNANTTVDSADGAGVSASTGTEDTPSANTGGTSGGTAAVVESPKTWVADYAQVWVPNNVYVVDSPAHDERVDTGRAYLQCSCGQTFATQDEWSAHVQAGGYNGPNAQDSYSAKPLYETVHHDEVGHWEDQGHYETVESGGHWE